MIQEKQMKQNINYYFCATQLFHLLKAELITQEEYRKANERLVEICQPDPEYIR